MGLIYLDACLLIHAFERHPQFGARVRAALAAEPPERLAISPLVMLECLVAPMGDGNAELQRYYEDGLARFVSLPLSTEVFVHAAALRARFGLKTPDALHLAVAQVHRCDAFWTNDDRLAHVARGLAINLFA